MKERVCVIIPAYNEEEVIRDCLEGLDRQDYPNFEVFLIDDLSTDKTKEIIQSFVNASPQKFRLFEFGKVGPGKARNLVALETRADILAFTDADCIPTPQWLSQLVQGFLSDPQVGSTGGPHRAPPQSNPFQLLVEEFLLQSAPAIDFVKTEAGGIQPTNHNPLCNVAYRRDLFVRLKGFREDLFPGEDVELDQRVRNLGFKITYNPNALVFHHRPENISQWRKVMHAYGRAQGKMLRETGLKRKPQLIGLMFLLFAFSTAPILIVSYGAQGLLLFLFLLVCIFYLRPDSEGFISLRLNALQWLNGFCEGFITRRSEPPGYRAKSLQERKAKLKKD
jgi:cellulose synthase/poly-beta-1,6-N-acetylglucosamine synthase-like glycosyltransferase